MLRSGTCNWCFHESKELLLADAISSLKLLLIILSARLCLFSSLRLLDCYNMCLLTSTIQAVFIVSNINRSLIRTDVHFIIELCLISLLMFDSIMSHTIIAIHLDRPVF